MKIKNLKEKLLTCALIAVIVAAMYIFHIPCPFKAIFTIPCPGCGMTRAAFSLLKLDFASAFYFNPLVFTMPFFGILGLIFRKDRKKLKIIVSILCIALLALYVYRMVTGSAPDVVYFDPEKGMIYKFVRSVING